MMLKFNHRLLYAEETLACLKKALRLTSLWTSLKLQHSEDYNPSTTLARVTLKIEGFPGYNTFLGKFWAKTRGFKGSSAYVSLADAPSYFMLQTENRKAFYNHIPALAKALHGKNISLSEVEVNWRWDLTRTRKNGQPRHLQSYEVTIYMDSQVPFDSETWLEHALTSVCPSTDLRADEYPFEVVEKKMGANTCRSMQKTSTGLILGFDTTTEAENVVNAIYADCEPTYHTKPYSNLVYVSLTYPDMQEVCEEAL